MAHMRQLCFPQFGLVSGTMPCWGMIGRGVYVMIAILCLLDEHFFLDVSFLGALPFLST